MPRNKLNVRVLPLRSESDVLDEFEDVQFISLVNNETYGKPAIISEEAKDEGLPCRILYVNPQNIVAMEVDRIA